MQTSFSGIGNQWVAGAYPEERTFEAKPDRPRFRLIVCASVDTSVLVAIAALTLLMDSDKQKRAGNVPGPSLTLSLSIITRE